MTAHSPICACNGCIVARRVAPGLPVIIDGEHRESASLAVVGAKVGATIAVLRDERARPLDVAIGAVLGGFLGALIDTVVEQRREIDELKRRGGA